MQKVAKHFFFLLGWGPGEFFESLAWFFSQVVVLGRIYWPIPLAYLLCASLIIEMGNEYMISFVCGLYVRLLEKTVESQGLNSNTRWTITSFFFPKDLMAEMIIRFKGNIYDNWLST
jgi:hypothetical protein